MSERSTQERSRKQREWIDNRTRVMVCTNAFGMGIDKPDVRFVLHFGLSDSIESYFQEAGRAGRDGKPSTALMFWNSDDCKRLRQMHTTSFPSLEYIEDIYHKVHAYFGIAYENGMGKQLRFCLPEFCKQFGLNQLQAYNAVKYLDRCGQWIMMEEVDIPTKIMITADRMELYDIEYEDPLMRDIMELAMRRYEGIFSFPCIVDEKLFAHHLGIEIPRLRQLFYLLSTQHVIRYIPAAVSDVIYLLTNRLYPKDVNLKPELYKRLMETSARRTEAMIRFVSDDSRSKSAQLLEYFGQKE
ncbi:MAG: hypothetical protein MJY92_04545 [Bacteroidales bacterium]|nr:hypothetical protein [Bacteroidales bacterium]